ncbi:hypothetical protein HK096_001809, partial [Nowakowskiella sp. JEL0078]
MRVSTVAEEILEVGGIVAGAAMVKALGEVTGLGGPVSLRAAAVLVKIAVISRVDVVAGWVLACIMEHSTTWSVLADFEVENWHLELRWSLIGLCCGVNSDVRNVLSKRVGSGGVVTSEILDRLKDAEAVDVIALMQLCADLGGASSQDPNLAVVVCRMVYEIAFGWVVDALARKPKRKGSLSEHESALWETHQAGAALVQKLYLPVPLWKPDLSDLDVLQNMMKDPIGSIKFTIAKTVLARLNWGAVAVRSTDDDIGGKPFDLFLPRSHHRVVAIAVTNIYLDRLPRPQNDKATALVSTRSTATAVGKSIEYATDIAASATKIMIGDKGADVVKNTGALAQNAVAVVGAYAPNVSIPVPNIQISWTSKSEADFADWCWRFVLSLDLYQPPKSSHTYYLAMNDTFMRPFLPLDTPMLATLRGAMNTDALAAYVLIMISELGHHLPTFQSITWPLLTSVLSTYTARPAALRIMTDVFPSLLRDCGKIWFDDVHWKTFAEKLRPNPDVSTNIYRHLGNAVRDYAEWRLRGKSTEIDVDDVLTIWIRALVSADVWIFDVATVKAVDAVVEVSAVVGGTIANVVRRELKLELKRLVERWYERESKESLAKNAWDAVWGIEGPSLVIRSLTDSLISSVGVVPSLKMAELAPWFVVEGCEIEVEWESELRMKIADILFKKEKFVSVEKNGKKRTLETLCLWKVVGLILDLPVSHAVTPRMWKLFYSLYFERTANLSAFTDVPGLGFLLLKARSDLKSKLITRLNSTTQFYNELIAKQQSVTISGQYSESSLFNESVYLLSLYNAFTMWLQESRFGNNPDQIDISSLSEKYMPVKMEECIRGDVFNFRDDERNVWLEINLKQCERHSDMIRDALIIENASQETIDMPENQKSRRNSISMGGPAQPAPIFLARTPLIPSVPTSETLAKFNADIAFLSKRARAFRTIVIQHQNADDEYITHLSKLYVNDARKERKERKCRGGVMAPDGNISRQCRGAAVVDMHIMQVLMLSEVKDLLANSRQTVEELAGAEYVDAAACISALRIASVVGGLVGAFADDSSEYEGSDRTDAVDKFYDLLTGLDPMIVSEYRPLEWILSDSVDVLGQRVVTGSEPTKRLFALIMMNGAEGGSSVDLGGEKPGSKWVRKVSKIFRPASAP